MRRLALFILVAALIGVAWASGYLLWQQWQVVPGAVVTTQPQAAKRGKVLVIGLDGATWDVLLPLMDQGHLPHITSFLKEGCYGRLHSTRGYSAPSWTSIFSGYSAEKHGIYDFTFPNEAVLKVFNGAKGAPELADRINTASVMRQVPAVWNQLSEAGLKTGAVGVVITYPAEPINGFVVSGDGTPALLDERISSLSATLKPAEGWQNLPQSTLPGLEGATQFSGGEIFLLATAEGDTSYNQVRLCTAKDASTAFVQLEGNEPRWISFCLDNRFHQVMATDGDVVPSVRIPSGWKKLPSTSMPPLEVVFPSGVSPIEHGKKKNLPVSFILYSDDPGGKVYNQVLAGYSRNGATLSGTLEAYGLEVKLRLDTDNTGALPSGRPVLDLQWVVKGVSEPFHIFLSSSPDISSGPYDTVTIGVNQQRTRVESQNDLDLFWEWVLSARRKVGGQACAIPAWVKASVSQLDPVRVSIRFDPYAYQSFTFPLYPQTWPRDLLEDAPPEPLLEGYDPIFRSQGFKAAAARYLMPRMSWDLFLMGFTRIDLVQHGPWNSPDVTSLDLNDFDEVIRKSWKELDDIVGNLIQLAGPETTVILCSDHGFNPLLDRRRLVWRLNPLLKAGGFLTSQSKEDSLPSKEHFPQIEAYRFTYVWQLEKPITTTEAVQLHLVDKKNQSVARFSHPAGMGAFPLPYWKVGDVVKSVYDVAIPEDVAPGEYSWQLQLGGEKHEVGTGKVSPLPDPLPLMFPKVWNPIYRAGVWDRVPPEIAKDGNFQAQEVKFAKGLKLISFKVEAIKNSYRLYGYGEEDTVEWQATTVYAYDRPGLFSAPPRIDWRPPDTGIYINLHERQPHGSVSKEKYLDTLEDLNNFLASARVVETGKPFFSNLRKTGSPADKGADIRFTVAPELTKEVIRVDNIDYETYDAHLHVEAERNGKKIVLPLTELATNQIIGVHNSYGIFAAKGFRVKKQGQIPIHEEVDITPTLLRLLDVPIPDDLDGKVITGPFDFGPETQGATSEKIAAQEKSSEEVLQELKSIGYIGGMQQRAEEVSQTLQEEKPAGEAVNAFEGGEGAEPGKFAQPRAVAAAKDGTLYAADFRNARIQKFTSDGKPLAQWGSAGSGKGEFKDPVGVAVGPEGEVFVADTWNHRIQIFSPEGKYLREFSGPDFNFFAPKTLTFEPSTGLLFVADTGTATVKAINADGQVVRTIGVRGEAPGQFQEPTAVGFAGNGNFFVADTKNLRLQEFKADGTFIREVSVSGYKSRGTNDPMLTRGPDGAVYGTIPYDNAVFRIKPGGPLEVLSSIPDGELERPTGLTFLPSGELVIADTGHHRLYKTKVR